MEEVVVPTTQPNPGGVVTAPADIEKELRRIWREAAKLDSQNEAEVQPRIRAVLSNILLIVSSEISNAQVDKLVEELLLTYPSRFFIIRQNEATELETRVSSRCVMTSAGNHVCSEEVLISASAAGIPFVPNLLLSLLVADVGVKAILLGDPAGENVFSLLTRVLPMVDLVIYDSILCPNVCDATARFLNLREPSKRGEERDKKRERRMRMRDLNWYRLERWRTLVAEQFNRQSLRAEAMSIREIRLTSAGKTETPPAGEAMLLAGWVAACLKHSAGFSKTQTGKSIHVRSLDEKHPLEIFFDEQESNLEKGSLVGVEIAMTNGTKVSLQLDGKEQVVHVQTSIKGSGAGVADTSDRRVAFPLLAPERLMSEPLNSSGVDDYFMRSLEYAFRMFGES